MRWWHVLVVAALPTTLLASSLTADNGTGGAEAGELLGFTNGTVADADQVNHNFAEVRQAINDNDARIRIAELECPAGFTRMASQGRTLGCIHTNVEGTANCIDAALACFDTYGGRLPTLQERILAFHRYNITVPAEEYTGDWFKDSAQLKRCSTVGTSGDINSGGFSSTRSYRCFIPNP
jgi:hypothetical protein